MTLWKTSLKNSIKNGTLNKNKRISTYVFARKHQRFCIFNNLQYFRYNNTNTCYNNYYRINNLYKEAMLKLPKEFPPYLIKISIDNGKNIEVSFRILSFE